MLTMTADGSSRKRSDVCPMPVRAANERHESAILHGVEYNNQWMMLTIETTHLRLNLCLIKNKEISTVYDALRSRIHSVISDQGLTERI